MKKVDLIKIEDCTYLSIVCSGVIIAVSHSYLEYGVKALEVTSVIEGVVVGYLVVDRGVVLHPCAPVYFLTYFLFRIVEKLSLWFSLVV
jgi:hypothetical protein